MGRNRINYQKELEVMLKQTSEGEPKRLLLHSCCAPCSSYCLEYLSQFFLVTIFYYNPNIFPPEEYGHRVREQIRLVEELNPKLRYAAAVLEGSYKPEDFFTAVKGYESCQEGGERCFLCYEQRLLEAALAAKDHGFDYFTTTLTISPLKDAQKLNEIGNRIGKEYGVAWLPSDFKKRNGYQRSIELSKEYNLYRQNYCGCIFSKREAEWREASVKPLDDVRCDTTHAAKMGQSIKK